MTIGDNKHRLIKKSGNFASYFIPAFGFFMIIVLSTYSQNLSVSAFSQVTSRSIKMSNSAAGASGVKYTVSFTTATTGVIQGVAVDFCAGTSDPIIGDACTAPTGFTVGSTLTSANTGLSPTASASWTQTSVNTGRTFEMYDASGASVTAPAAITFEILSNTNPSGTAGTFYARIFTFSSVAGMNTTWNGVTNGSSTSTVVDAGGIALSTVAQITITAKVQELITFCVYTATYDGGNCSAASGNSVTLGSGTGGVLSFSSSYIDNSTKYDIQTNASNGATIRFTASGSYGTLFAGTNSIAKTAGTSGTCTTNTSCVYASNTDQFGLCDYQAAGSTITVSAPYNGANCNLATPTGSNNASTANFGLDIAADEGTYGSTLATVTAGAAAEGVVTFLGGISNTQPAGVYSTVLTFIATGSY